MTTTESELNIKLLYAQTKIIKLEHRLDKVEAVLDAMCIKRQYKLFGFFRDYLPSWRARRK